jgi:hypothetical protein
MLSIALLGVLEEAVQQLQHRRIAGVEQVADRGGEPILDEVDPEGVVRGGRLTRGGHAQQIPRHPDIGVGHGRAGRHKPRVGGRQRPVTLEQLKEPAEVGPCQCRRAPSPSSTMVSIAWTAEASPVTGTSSGMRSGTRKYRVDACAFGEPTKTWSFP